MWFIGVICGLAVPAVIGVLYGLFVRKALMKVY
jgi:hypothetical protein